MQRQSEESLAISDVIGNTDMVENGLSDTSHLLKIFALFDTADCYLEVRVARL